MELYEESDKIMKILMKNQTIISAEGIMTIAKLADASSNAEMSDEDAQKAFHTLLNLAQIGYVTTANVRKGVTRLLGEDPTKDFKPSMMDKPEKGEAGGNLNFL